MSISSRLGGELADLVAKKSGRVRLAISGTSMRPLLQAGMVIDVVPLTARPRTGDILVFKTRKGLVAHRLVGGESLSYRAAGKLVADRDALPSRRELITCGDAHPDRTESVPPAQVVGRVTAVWSSGAADARRVDGARYHMLGILLTRTRRLRALAGKVRGVAALAFRSPRQSAEPAAFAALLDSSALFENGHYERALAALHTVPLSNLLETARRHRAGGLLTSWIEDAARAQIPIEPALADAVRRMGWINSIQAGRVVRCARHVCALLNSAGIPHILLKGGARIAAGEVGAERLFSSDVDVLVPAASADHAFSLLRAAAYKDVATSHGRTPADHHRPPLFSPHVDVAVEIHVGLVPRAEVSASLDYDTLVHRSRRVHGPMGAVDVLDPVGSALHLAYHARDFSAWRDIVLLARLLKQFDSNARADFDRQVAAERRDFMRLASAVAAADAIAFATPARGSAARYLAWVRIREDLPHSLRDLSDAFEALNGRCALVRLARHRGRAKPVQFFKWFVLNLVAVPSILQAARRR
jgi:hypothetical protein